MTQKELKAELKSLLQEKAKIDERIKNCKKYIIFKPKKYDLDKIHWKDIPYGQYNIKWKNNVKTDKSNRFNQYLDIKIVEIGDYEDDYSYMRYDYFAFMDDEGKKILNQFEREKLEGCYILTIENNYYRPQK